MLKNKFFYTTVITNIFSIIVCFGQVTRQKIPVKELLESLKKNHSVQFNYRSDLLNDIVVFPFKKGSLEEQIKSIEKQTSLRFFKVSQQIITVTKAISVCGYVKDDTTNQPLVGATVLTTDNHTLTDDKGYFMLSDVREDDTISIRYLGFRSYNEIASSFLVGSCLKIMMSEHIEGIAPVVIEGYLVEGIDKSEEGSTVINFSKFSTVPGLIESDVLQTIQALPGILSTDETVSNINIRGGSHDQNLILWDGIKMYQTGHFFGLISGFHPQITKRVSVTSNGTDASYTDGVSGTIRMQTDNNIQTRFKGNVSINFISTDAFFDIPISEKSSFQIAGRKSINRWVRTPTYNTYFDRVIQLTEIENNIDNVVNSDQDFDFYDTSLRWLYNPTGKDAFRVNFIFINNNLSFNETALVSNVFETRESTLSQQNIAGGIHYTRKWNRKFSTELSIYETDYKLDAVNANVVEQQRFLQENIVSETGAKLQGNYLVNDLDVGIGYQFIESKVINKNDVDSPPFLRLISEVIREHAFFTQVNYHNKENNFYIKPGIRLNYIEKFSKFLIEPRVSLRKQFNEHFQVEILGELKHQNTTKVVNFQTDFLGIEKRRWQLANDEDIPILTSQQLSSGVSYVNKGWLVDLKGYYKKVQGITAQSQGFTSKYEFSKVIGDYKTVGFDILLRKRIKKLRTWLSYSFMDNDYVFDTLEEKQFPSNFDNTHSLTFGTTYSNDNLRMSVGFNYRTGKPTTIPVEGNEVVNDVVNFGVANSSRLEDYIRADASTTYNFKLTENLGAEVGVSVWNLLNKKNKINNFYRVNENQLNASSRYSLGTTFNAVFRVHF